jgi:FkbM family methyltransferase
VSGRPPDPTGPEHLTAALDRRVAAARRNRAIRLLRDPLLSVRRKLLPGHLERFETFWGRRMIGFSTETVAATIMTSGFFEERLTRTMLALIRNGMTVVDIGAHIGYFTLLAAHLVADSGHVMSFEPTPSTRGLLLRNVNGLSNVIVRPRAAWSEAATLHLRDFGGRFSAFNSFTVPRAPIAAYRVVEVEAVAADDEIKEHKLRPDFIKIDVESAEHQVLEGLSKTLEGVRPIVSVEVGDVGVPGVWGTTDLIAFMGSRFGYSPFEWRGRSLEPLRPREQWSYDNLIFGPRERPIAR